MATTSVAIRNTDPFRNPHGYDLWLGKDVLTVEINKNNKNFPPENSHVEKLTDMIRHCGRALPLLAKAAAESTEPDFDLEPVEAIGEVIVLLTQLLDAVRRETSAEGLLSPTVELSMLMRKLSPQQLSCARAVFAGLRCGVLDPETMDAINQNDSPMKAMLEWCAGTTPDQRARIEAEWAKFEGA